MTQDVTPIFEAPNHKQCQALNAPTRPLGVTVYELKSKSIARRFNMVMMLRGHWQTMGYLLSAHIVREEPSVDRLAELPSSIGWRVYRHRSAKVYIIDTFRASRPPDYPFQTPVPAVELPLELPPELNDLQAVYDYLIKVKLANSFKTSYINFALMLNRVCEAPILSFISDDDDWDFACTVANGSLSRLKCQCGDLVITYQNGNTQVEPLIPEFDDDLEFLTDVHDLRAALPQVAVGDRNVPWDTQLHRIAIEEWRLFGNTDTMILGLGSFDPPEDHADCQLIGGS